MPYKTQGHANSNEPHMVMAVKSNKKTIRCHIRTYIQNQGHTNYNAIFGHTRPHKAIQDKHGNSIP